jgi:hypothetical protein
VDQAIPLISGRPLCDYLPARAIPAERRPFARLPVCPLRCRIWPYLIKAAPLRSAPPRPGVSAGSALLARRRTPAQHAGSGPLINLVIRQHIGGATAWALHRLLPAPLRRPARTPLDRRGASSASDCVALQGRPVKGAPSGRVATAMAQAPPLTGLPLQADLAAVE